MKHGKLEILRRQVSCSTGVPVRMTSQRADREEREELSSAVANFARVIVSLNWTTTREVPHALDATGPV